MSNGPTIMPEEQRRIFINLVNAGAPVTMLMGFLAQALINSDDKSEADLGVTFDLLAQNVFDKNKRAH